MEGYTIVEVLIFLAASGAFFVMAMSLFGGQQGKTEFTNAVRDFESQLLDISNDVSTGYYNSSEDFSCGINVATNLPEISDTDAALGTNQDCTFVGKVINLGEGSPADPKIFKIYTVVGRRLKVNSSSPATTYAEAMPVASAGASGALIETRTFDNAMTVLSATYDKGGFSTPAGLGFFNSFGVPRVGQQSTGKTSYDLVPIENLAGRGQNGVIIRINDQANHASANPASGIRICLKSGTSDQHALIILGGSGRTSGSVATIGSSTLCT